MLWAISVGNGARDQLSVGAQGEGEATVAMGKVFAFLQHGKLSNSLCPADPEVGRCVQSHRVSRKKHVHKNTRINPVLKKKNTAN